MSFISFTPAWRANSRMPVLRPSWFHPLFLSLTLASAACGSDTTAATAPAPSRSSAPSAAATPTYQSRHALLTQLDRAAAHAPASSRSQSVQIIDGREQRLDGLDAIRRALRRTGQGHHVGAALGRYESFGIPADEPDSLRMVRPMSIVLTEPSRFRFLSYTDINKLGAARFTFSGGRSVHALVGQAAMLVWSDQGTVTTTEADGDSSVEWPSFQISSGCKFSGSMNTRHEAVWPWGFLIPGFLPRHADPISTGGNGELQRDCSGAAVPPAPPPPESQCIDPALAGCENGNGGSGRSGATQQREVGRSGGSKTVCWVTDWYENGVFVETTYDACWTELIY